MPDEPAAAGGPAATVACEAPTPAATRALARALGARLTAGDVVALIGGLGVGKTLFVRGVVEGLGGDPLAVCSPSFALVQRYEARVPLVHVDLYRLEAEEAAYDLGLGEDEDAVLAVEWADRAPELLPSDRVEVHLALAGAPARPPGSAGGEEPAPAEEPPEVAPRRIELRALGPRAAERLHGLQAPPPWCPESENR